MIPGFHRASCEASPHVQSSSSVCPAHVVRPSFVKLEPVTGLQEIFPAAFPSPERLESSVSLDLFDST
jgi:hypothetical protein